MVTDIDTIKNKGILIYFYAAMTFLTGMVLANIGYALAKYGYIEINRILVFITLAFLTCIIFLILFSFALRYDESIIIATDLTSELHLLNQKLIELENFRNEFFSLVTHEIKTPITAIRWSVELIVDEAIPENVKSQIQEIGRQNAILIKMTDNLLNISRIDSGRLRVSPEETDLETIVNETLEPLKSIASEHKIELSININNSKMVMLDRNIFKNVLTNLTSNAIKYSKDGSKVSINTDVSADAFTIKVKDSGIGIPESQQDKVFSKFFRADNTSKISGSGFGLYLVKKLIDASGGEIGFTSKVGEGSEFFFTYNLPGMVYKEGDVVFS